MAREIRKPIGSGQLDWGDKRNSTTSRRNLFLAKVADLEPQETIKPLRYLSDKPLEIYKQSLGDIASAYQVYEKLIKEQRAVGVFQLFSYLPKAHPLIKSIKKWSLAYHLDADWCREAVLLTLKSWNDFPNLLIKPLKFEELYSALDIRYVHHDSFKKRDKEFLSYYPYKFQMEDRKKYLAGIKDLLKNAFDLPVFYLLTETEIQVLKQSLNDAARRLCEKIEKKAKQNGYISPDQQSKLDLHITWAAKYQVYGARYSHLGGGKTGDKQSIKTASQTVCTAIDELLRDIVLRKRPSKRGRPSLQEIPS